MESMYSWGSCLAFPSHLFFPLVYLSPELLTNSAFCIWAWDRKGTPQNRAERPQISTLLLLMLPHLPPGAESPQPQETYAETSQAAIHACLKLCPTVYRVASLLLCRHQILQRFKNLLCQCYHKFPSSSVWHSLCKD